MSDRAGEEPDSQLPDGWAWTTIGDVVQPRKEKVTPSVAPELPFIGMEDVESHSMRILGTRVFGSMRSTANRFYSLDILYGRLRPYLNKVITPDFEGACSGEFIVIPAPSGIDPRFLRLRINCPDFVDFASHTVEGDRPRIDFRDIQDFPFALPPFAEQKRIVEKIETLLSEIANGVESLDAVDRKLATYRQSFLKAAVTGELTRDVRDRSRFAETGSDLLQRVLKERATEARSKNKEPFEPTSKIEFEIPDSWTIATVDQLSRATDYGTSAKCSPTEGEVPVLRMGNLQHGELDLSALKYLPSDRSEFPKLLLRDGDLLFNRTNSAELVGKTSVYRGNPPHCSFASYIVRVQLNGMIPEFLAAFINSIFGRRWIKSVVSQQVGQANVNSTKLRALSVPLPPLDEQQIIVDRLEDLKSGLDRARAGAEGQSFRAGSLRRSILNSAFSGRLVPQNPSDEPASELLARICLERAKAPKTTARRGRPRKTSGASEGATR